MNLKGAFTKKIAIVTGASGGIGQIFVREIIKEALDEIWVIARNQELNCQRFIVKLVPQRLIMKAWLHEIRKYI